MPEDTAPAVLEPIIPEGELPVLTVDELTSESTESEGITADAKVISYHIATVAYAVRAATTISDICKLALTSSKLLEARRNMLCKPYGYQDPKSGKPFSFSVE